MVLISLTLVAILSIIAGIIILIWPKILNIVVALWLIIAGMLQLLSNYNLF